MHAEYDESQLPIPPERRRTRPNRRGAGDPKIADGKQAIGFVRLVCSGNLYDVGIRAIDDRLVLVDKVTGREFMPLWSDAKPGPEEAI